MALLAKNGALEDFKMPTVHLLLKVDRVDGGRRIRQPRETLGRVIGRAVVDEAERKPRPSLRRFEECIRTQPIEFVVARDDKRERLHFGAPSPQGPW